MLHWWSSLCMQGVCIVYDIILNVKADPVDLLQLKVSTCLSWISIKYQCIDA